MSISRDPWRWLTQPISLRRLLQTLRNVIVPTDPVRRYRWTYGVVAMLLIFSTYSFTAHRVLGNSLVLLLPLVGTVFGYLWAILLADELLGLFPARPWLPQLVRWVKRATLSVMFVYGVVALGLWANNMSAAPLADIPGHIVSIRKIDLGLVSYRALTVQDVDNKSGRQTILGNNDDQWTLYGGQNVRLITRRGLLGLTRVLQVYEDMEKYYLRMLDVAPNAKVALEHLVGIYAEDAKFAQAMDWDARLRARYPDEYETTLRLGQRLTDAKRFADAVTVLRHAAAVSREYEVLYSLGYALAWSGKKSEASEVLREATTVDPTDMRAYYSLGYVYSDLGNITEARAAWTKVLDILPDFPEVKQNLRRLPRTQ